MYCLTDAQVDYILNDIRRNGVEMEDLQLNLLDHICCIVEQQLEEDGDFERFYQETIRQFYKKELREIEEETINLLTYKNYYGMKKLMIVSGAFSAVAFIFGSFFKVMHWPGASVLLCLAILTLGFVFLPLMTLLKTKESGTGREKIVIAVGALVGILFSMSTLFAVMHWPGAMVLWVSTISVSMFVLVPLYYFNGIRKPEARLNTIITTVLLIAITGLTFTMLRIRKPKQTNLYTYAQNEHLLRNMQRSTHISDPMAIKINNTCSQIKAMILNADMGVSSLPLNFDVNTSPVQEANLNGYPDNRKLPDMLAQLKAQLVKYNSTIPDADSKIPVDDILLNGGDDIGLFTNFYVLNNLTQLQMFVATAEANKLALK
jgi:hypothetical protein